MLAVVSHVGRADFPSANRRMEAACGRPPLHKHPLAPHISDGKCQHDGVSVLGLWRFYREDITCDLGNLSGKGTHVLDACYCIPDMMKLTTKVLHKFCVGRVIRALMRQ